MADDHKEDRVRDFAREVERGIETLQREIGYNPTRFRQMVYDHGAVETARRLLSSPHVSDGFTKLWEHNRLDQSIEWLVLVYDDLFDDEDREQAHRRLKLHDAPVDDWLRSRLGRRWP